jgi:hypothetical protein
MAVLGKSMEWRLEVPEGVSPVEVKPGEAAFLPLGLTMSGGVVSGEAAIPGWYEVPVEVRDAGANVLRTTVEVVVSGPETGLPALGVRLKNDGCRLTAEWTPVADEIQVRAYGGEGGAPLEVEVSHTQTGERAVGRYPAPGPCNSPQA